MTIERTERETRRTQRRHDRLTDRWIDLLAASYGMPRVTLLRELGTMPHLARAIGALIAEQEKAPAKSTARAVETDLFFQRFANGEFS